MSYSKNLEDKDHWVVYPQTMNEAEVINDFRSFTGREPDVMHSPEDSGTKFWFVGYVSLKEKQAESNKNKI